jgi:predicted porin
MKKTLIALAALAATTAFAQSTVTIGGTLEVAPARSTKLTTQTGDNAALTVKGSNLGQHNTWSTSVLSISAVEDLGGGLKASAVMISGVGDGFAARERTLALEGGFGTIRFGRFVTAAAAGFHGFSGAGSATLVGSIYGMSTGSGAAGTTDFGLGSVVGINNAARGNLHNSIFN